MSVLRFAPSQIAFTLDDIKDETNGSLQDATTERELRTIAATLRGYAHKGGLDGLGVCFCVGWAVTIADAADGLARHEREAYAYASGRVRNEVAYCERATAEWFEDNRERLLR